MNYLQDYQVYPGAIVKLERKNSFEGFARLLTPCGENVPFYDDKQSRKLLLRQRWMIEWLDLDEELIITSDGSTHVLNQTERMTQLSLSKHRTHRNIEFYAGSTKADYTPPEEPDTSYEKTIDDFGGLF